MRHRILKGSREKRMHPIEFLPVEKAIEEIEKAKIAKATKTLLIALLKRVG